MMNSFLQAPFLVVCLIWTGLGFPTARAEEAYSVPLPEGSTVSDLLWERVEAIPEPRPRIYGPKGLVKRTFEINPGIRDPHAIPAGTPILLPFPGPSSKSEPSVELRSQPQIVERTDTAKQEPAKQEPAKQEPAAQEPQPERPHPQPSARPPTASIELGYQSHWYEDRLKQVNQGALTLGASKAFELSGPFINRVWARSRVSLLQVTSTLPGANARYFEASALFGQYRESAGAVQWSTGLGGSYKTMWVSSSDSSLVYGYQNVMGPTLSVSASWRGYSLGLSASIYRSEGAWLSSRNWELELSARQRLSRRLFLQQTYNYLTLSFSSATSGAFSTLVVKDPSLLLSLGLWL